MSAPQPKPRVYVETYGCQMNLADSQLVSGILEQAGYTSTTREEDADVILVNTCAVRERAEERVMGRIHALKQQKTTRKGVVLGVVGCMAEHLRARLVDQAPHVDVVAGPDTYRRLPEMLRATAEVDGPVVDVRLDKAEIYDGAASKVDGVNGWVSIQRGCDKFCTFCIVPYVRGRERSAPPREILRQVRALVEQGAREITLLGQTVNSYRYEEATFADLLEAVCGVEGVLRVRFTSPYPLDFSPRLVEVMAAQPRVMPHVHLPLQSGCDDVLARMRRGHTIDQYLTLVSQLRRAIPRISLTTDVIVGFPDESEASFQRTLDAVAAIRFDAAFMFAYSERSHTYASKNLPDSVPREEKVARLTRLIALQEGISAEVNRPLVGQTVPVLVTGFSRRSTEHMTGKTDTFKSTVFPVVDRAIAPGDLVEVRVEETTSHTLLGRLTEPQTNANDQKPQMDADGLRLRVT